MLINTETIFSMTQANQNFSVVARAADRNGEAVVFKNNRPKYLVINMENSEDDIVQYRGQIIHVSLYEQTGNGRFPQYCKTISFQRTYENAE